jgi:hypothetical protein
MTNLALQMNPSINKREKKKKKNSKCSRAVEAVISRHGDKRTPKPIDMQTLKIIIIIIISNYMQT